ALSILEHHDLAHVLRGEVEDGGQAGRGPKPSLGREQLVGNVSLDQIVVDVNAGPHGPSIPDRRFVTEKAVRRGRPLAGPSLAADLLVELHAVPPLGGVPALLAPDPADLAEELIPVALLRGEAALTPGLGAGHLHLTGHCSAPPRLPPWSVPRPAARQT